MTTTITRKSPVKDARHESAYTNFAAPGQVHQIFPDEPGYRTLKPQGFANLWSPKAPSPGYGSRHIYDSAPFNLWDVQEGTFRYPSSLGYDWIREEFGAVGVTIGFPVILIETNTPPNPVPLTVGGVLTHFVPPGSDVLPRPIWPNSISYSNHRMEDPLGQTLQLPKFGHPTVEEMTMVKDALKSYCNLKAVNFISPQIVVELHFDGRVYSHMSLPGVVAGRPTLYHHADAGYWEGKQKLACERVITPEKKSCQQDTTDYLEAHGFLNPGIRLASEQFDTETLTEASGATTAGVLVRRGVEERMTASYHGVLKNGNELSQTVSHPLFDSTPIGETAEAFPELDIVFIQLRPEIRFRNNEYFGADGPRRLLRHDEICGEWCTLDGMSTGVVALCHQYSRILEGKDSKQQPTRRVAWQTEYIFETVGPTAGQQVVHGICGAPIVKDDGGVAGFFHEADNNGRWCLCAALDDLIETGWQLV